MAKFTCYFIFIVLVCYEGVRSKSLNYDIKFANKTENRIVGGQPTSIRDYNYQAYLVACDGLNYFECGGSILNENFIVTAGQCVSGMEFITVRIGSTYKLSGGTTYVTDTFYCHPDFDPFTLDFDVGIVEIKEGMDLDGVNARAVSLVPSGNDPQEGEKLVITGWGATEEDGPTVDILRVAKVPVVDRGVCAETLYCDITTRMICAGFMEGEYDTCQGDTGGPAVLSANGMLAGITSFGEGCARPESPGVYTRVGQPEIRSFILSTAGA